MAEDNKNNDYRQPSDTKIKERKQYLDNKRINRQYRSERVGGALSVFGIIIALVLIVSVFRMLRNPDGYSLPTFQSLLEMLVNLDGVDLGFINSEVIVLGDWGFMNFLRDFIAFFIDIINVLIFVFQGLINLVLYAYSILQWIFV